LDCLLFFAFNLVVTVLIGGGVVTVAGKGEMAVGGITITLGAGLVFVIAVWLAFFLFC
jgi:hypothetical protein